MTHSRSEHRRRRTTWLIAVVALWSLAGCGGDGPSAPGGGVEPEPGEPLALTTTVLSLDEEHAPLQDRIDWSDDDRWLLYAAGPGSGIFRVAVDGQSHPVPVSDPDDTSWLDADYSPVALRGGRVAFFHGWYRGDTRYHLLVADSSSIAGTGIAILHRFSPDLVGLSASQISSPQALTISADGNRAIGFWRAAYLLDWPAGDPDTAPTVRRLTTVTAAGDLALTRDGSRLVYRDGHGELVIEEIDVGNTPVPVGAGTLPAWDGTGERLVYLDPAGRIVVWDLPDGRRTVHLPDTETPITALALSWAGDRIAMLVKGAERFELRVGTLGIPTARAPL